MHKPETIITTVYKSGGDYTMEHVEALRRQIEGLVVLGVDEPLGGDWHGWWAKMNLFDPAAPNDILYFDLDTVVRGNIDKYKNLNQTHLLRDFYYPDNTIGSGMMYICAKDKRRVWDMWKKCPKVWMNRFKGDGQFIQPILKNISLRWQDEFPDEIISYKRHISERDKHFVGDGDIDSAKVICFHGEPRPWDAPHPWFVKYYEELMEGYGD